MNRKMNHAALWVVKAHDPPLWVVCIATLNFNRKSGWVVLISPDMGGLWVVAPLVFRVVRMAPSYPVAHDGSWVSAILSNSKTETKIAPVS